MFVDDSIIYVTGEDSSEIERKLNCDLSNTVKWLDSNSLQLNTTKTKFMLIHEPRKLYVINYCDIEINGIRLEEEIELRYLGIIIDNHLQFNSCGLYCKKSGKESELLV